MDEPFPTQWADEGLWCDECDEDLVPPIVTGETMTLEQAAAYIRAAYARGYTDSLADEEPWTIMQAHALARGLWAMLPVEA